MKTGAAGIALVEEFESCRLAAYRDGNGNWTIGWGHGWRKTRQIHAI